MDDRVTVEVRGVEHLLALYAHVERQLGSVLRVLNAGEQATRPPA